MLSLGTRKSFDLVFGKALLGASGFKEASSVLNNTRIAEYDRLYELKKEYFFIDQNHYAYIANRLSLLRKMPHLRKAQIIGFMSEITRPLTASMTLSNLSLIAAN